jgi:hypothetical protein
MRVQARVVHRPARNAVFELRKGAPASKKRLTIGENGPLLPTRATCRARIFPIRPGWAAFVLRYSSSAMQRMRTESVFAWGDDNGKREPASTRRGITCQDKYHAQPRLPTLMKAAITPF